MKLFELLKNIKTKKIIYSASKSKNICIKKLCFNSKKVDKKSIFFCISGTKVDATQYLSEAINNGAVAIVLQKQKISSIKNFDKNVTYIFVDNVRQTMAKMSANFYKNPQKKLKMIGITGTNGKTSTSYIIAQMLKNFNKKVGVIGTSGIFIDSKKYSATLTTPDSIELFKILSQMVKSKIEYCVMEVSAHAIYLDKTFGINWAVQVLTNIKTDHLDFFESQKKYQETKQSFFSKGNNFVINGDDKVGKILAQRYNKKSITFGFQANNDIKIKVCNLTLFDSNFDICYCKNYYNFSTNLVGRFNLYNFASALAVLQKLGFSMQKLQKIKQKYKILGRFSVFEYKSNCNIIIDYAHTTDSLKNFLQTVKSVSNNKNIIVFGCPGERESQKRFEMGYLAGKYCDFVIVTTDNPASENPRRIGFEILCGANKTNKNSAFIEDRSKAIKKAFELAKDNTNILIVGKGTEEYQIFGDKKIKYSDFDEIEKFINHKN